jgi:hypothetical protein
MNDLEKLFEHAPEGAVAILVKVNKKTLRYVNSEGKVWFGGDWVSCADGDTKTIATRPQQPRKTVEDAVEHFNKVWPNLSWNYAYCDIDTARWYCGNAAEEAFELVCTREEFEACVAAKSKSEPEWTHTIKGERCFIKESTPDVQGYILLSAEIRGYLLVKHDNPGLEPIKPIKPTISKSEAWDMVTTPDAEQSISVGGVLDAYTITD